MTATPTPWRLHPPMWTKGLGCIMRGNHIIATFDKYEDAALIVQAVNGRGDMISSLNQIASYIKGTVNEQQMGMRRIAHAALRKAEDDG